MPSLATQTLLTTPPTQYVQFGVDMSGMIALASVKVALDICCLLVVD